MQKWENMKIETWHDMTLIWKYPMSNGESNSPVSGTKEETRTTTKQFLDPEAAALKAQPKLLRERKVSEPLCLEARATLEETLYGLQKVPGKRYMY